jgi:2-amino-4-hydroxy-6-hydroxymethyldihydropteridine diphosphokinase
VERASRLYRTTPIGPNPAAPFLNAAAVLQTGLDPLSVLGRLHQIEDRLGRIRKKRWGPRTIDLDLLLYEGVQMHSHQIDVPHPGCLYRRFVLDPLADVAPDWLHPEAAQTIAALRERLLRRPLYLLVVGGAASDRQAVSAALAERFVDLRVTCSAVGCDGARSPVTWLTGGEADAVPQLALNLDLLPAGDCEAPRQLVRAMLDEPQPLGDFFSTAI